METFPNHFFYKTIFFIEFVEKLLTIEGIDVHLTDSDGVSSAHGAVGSGSLEILQLLVTAGIDVNVQDKYNLSLLHVASFSGQLGIFL